MNGFINDGAREAVDDPERRRIRGVTAQSVLVAFKLFAANSRKIDEFLARREADVKKVRKLSSRPRTRSLATWAPQTPSAVATPVDDASGDHYSLRRLGCSTPGGCGTYQVVVLSDYCWTRSTIGMMAGGCASSMPSSSMTGPRKVRNSSNASWLSQTSKT